MAMQGKITVALLILSAFSIITAGVFFMLDRSSQLSYGLYNNLSTNIQFVYNTPITPIGWVNNHWNAVFIWLALLVIYGLSTTFRRVRYSEECGVDNVERARYLYKHPYGGVIPSLVYLLIIVLCGTFIVHLFLWDMLLFRASAAVTLLSAVLAHVAYFTLASRVYYCQNILFDCAKAADVWLLRIFGINGLALMISWLTYLGLLNLSVAISYADGGSVGNIGLETSGKICGGIYLGWILVSILADLFFLERFTRYAVVHYISSMLLGCGIVLFRPSVYGHFPLGTQFGFAILGLSGFAFVIKLVFAVMRHFTMPLRSTGKEDKDSVDFMF